MKARPSDPTGRKPQQRPCPAPPSPAKVTRLAERWVVLEQGRCAHRMREDDLFPAERTLCGFPALDADWHVLPLLNSLPADYVTCRGCLAIARDNSSRDASLPATRQPRRAMWSWHEAVNLILLNVELELTQAALSVFQELFTHAQRTDQRCFPASIRRVAHRAGITIPVARKAVAGLVDAGVLRVTRQTFFGRHLGAPNVYTLLGPSSERHEA